MYFVINFALFSFLFKKNHPCLFFFFFLFLIMGDLVPCLNFSPWLMLPKMCSLFLFFEELVPRFISWLFSGYLFHNVYFLCITFLGLIYFLLILLYIYKHFEFNVQVTYFIFLKLVLMILLRALAYSAKSFGTFQYVFMCSILIFILIAF